jgi:leucyl aminopeptidase
MGALLGVGQGSEHESKLVVMRWQGAEDTKAAPVAFVGKGVTFDSGGISIKPAGGMEEMKWDMAGSATVIGTIRALAARKAKVNAVGVVGLVENMPSGTAQRPGDVVTSMSGQTIEVINTDAEGRLVLADALWYTQDRFKPKFMVDLATLTGAIIISLGHEYAGLFSGDDRLADRLTAAGKAVGEPLWRLPLGEAYDKQIKSDIADMKNVGGREGGSITAAQFLKRFTNDVPWAHLDIAGTAWSKKDTATCPKGATAFGVRLLDRLVADHYEEKGSK